MLKLSLIINWNEILVGKKNSTSGNNVSNIEKYREILRMLEWLLRGIFIFWRKTVKGWG